MRLFTGIDLPRPVKDGLERLLTQLRPAARLKWSPVENLHITTKFIGEWPDERLDELKAALGELPPRGSIPISIRRLGWFPNPRSPRVLWAGVEAPQALADLARDTERCLSRLGLPLENRDFSPHLTLARIRPPTDLRELQRTLAELPSADFGSFDAERFHLFESELRPSGPLYTKLAEFPLL